MKLMITTSEIFRLRTEPLSVPLFARLPTNRVVFDRVGDKAAEIGLP